MDQTRIAPTTELITFGQEEIINQHEWLDYLSAYDNGHYFEYPVNLNDVLKLMAIGIHHGSALRAKVNILSSTFVETPLLKRAEFKKFAHNYVVTGNGYLEIRHNVLQQPLTIVNRLSLYMRRHSNLHDFVYLRQNHSEHETLAGQNVIHVMEDDLSQEVYGVPSYLAAMHSIQLNHSATLFRRRYYDNGSHAGFILYANGQFNQDDWDELKQNLRNAKGAGNFKNILLRANAGADGGIKLIPISEVAAKDEFLNIKRLSANDQLVIHRVPPQLMSIMPEARSGFGDAGKAAEIFAANEVRPIQQHFESFNEVKGLEVFRFKEYEISSQKQARKGV